jgi:tetratricopeptide (TPR) repeat protein
LINAGAEYLQEGKAHAAIDALQQAYTLDATCVATLINLGGAYILAGRHKEAVPFLEAARDLEPHNTMVWINLGAAYLGNPVLAGPEEQMAAIAAFQQALALDPAAPSVHYNLGLIFVDRNEPELASAAFQQALQANPHDRDARNWLRRLREAENDSDG